MWIIPTHPLSPVFATCCFPAQAHESFYPPLPRTDTQVRETEQHPGYSKPSRGWYLGTEEGSSQTLRIQDDFLKEVLSNASRERLLQRKSLYKGPEAIESVVRIEERWKALHTAGS